MSGQGAVGSWQSKLLDVIPLARWAFYEVQLVACVAFVAAAACGLAGPPWWGATPVPLLLAWGVVFFYRDPDRKVTGDPQAFLAPADGRVVAVEPIEFDEFLGGPATRIHIYLSIFDVHVNRAPRDARVVATEYRPGERLDSRKPASRDRNESMWIGLEDAQGNRYSMRQIAGLVARRIACDLEPGDAVAAGEKFGMIKLGSGTELIVPSDAEVLCKMGDRVKAGVTILAKADAAA